MKISEKKSIEDYRLGKTSKEDFLKEVPFLMKENKTFGESILEEAIKNKDKENADLGLIIMLIQNDLFGFQINTKILCRFLLENWHFSHEDLAQILQDMKDPLTVDCLFKAAQIQFEYLNYDDTRQLARKCIKALSAIGDKKAIEKLNILSKHPNSEIQGYAVKELKDRKDF